MARAARFSTTAAIVFVAASVLCHSNLAYAEANSSVSSPSQHVPEAPKEIQSGPTPFPTCDREWPGVGAVRVFAYMSQNRAGFWKSRAKNQGAVVFVGDSLIGGWSNLAAAFPNLHVANLGIGGEPSRVLLFRLKEDVIDLAPQAVVILTGPNDMSAMENPTSLEANLREIVRKLRASNTKLPIVLSTLPPRDNPTAPVDPHLIVSYNKTLAGMFQDDSNIKIVDLYGALAAKNGSIDPDNFNKDRLHISPAGYAKFRDLIGPALVSMNVR